VILHLKTQDHQPYGSERRCCERCGIMIWGSPPDGPKWTDDRALYAAPPEPYVPCDKTS
jgi:hypothetical protein